MVQDFWWVNDESESILNRGYLLKGETIEDAVDRVVNAAASHYKGDLRKELKQRFKEAIKKGYLSMSSPIWSNMGTSRGLPISCFNVHIPDNVEGITHKMGEVIMQTKIGGGTSGYFGELRHRGSAVTDNGESSGAVSFMRLFDTSMEVVSQGGVRRGSFAAYLDIDHPDIEEFLQIKDIGNPIQNLFYAVCVPDYWIKEMKEGDTHKRNIWAKVLESRQFKGLPYIFFTDNVNKHKPEIYKELNLPINASNLCLVGDTEVCISPFESGDAAFLIKLSELVRRVNEGDKLYVYSRNEDGNMQYKLVEKGLIQGKKDIIEVSFGTFNIKGTRDHKFLNENGEWVELQDLIGNKIFNAGVIDIDEPEKNTLIGELISEEKDVEVYDITVADNHNFVVFGTNQWTRGGVTSKQIGDYDFELCELNSIVAHNCSEIALPSSMEESFVCCLSSLNLALYDEWKDTNLVETAIYFLDAVMSEFIKKTGDDYYLRAAHNFANRHRSLGLGVMGLHTYYQKQGWAFDDPLNVARNKALFKSIKEQAYAASEKIGDEYGYAPIFNEVDNPNIRKRRNTTLLAIAPTTSSSAILGQVSPGIEPYSSNFYKAGLAKGNYIRKNPQLVQVLEKYGKNNDDVWREIMLNQGSVQSLDFLSEDEKEVFKTFTEINQGEIINQAAARQEFIDQAQSLNLKIPSSAAIKDVNRLILTAWELGVKTLYYQRSTSVSKDMLSNIVSCSSCEA